MGTFSQVVVSKLTLKTCKRELLFIVILEIEKLVEGLAGDSNPGPPALTTAPQSLFVTAKYSEASSWEMSDCLGIKTAGQYC